MSNINLSLNEIIAKTKTSKGRGKGSSFKSDAISATRTGGIKKRNHGGKKNGSFTKSVPSGKWRNDKFSSVDSIAVSPSSTPFQSGVNENKKVRVNISNLAPSVVTDDLKELFSSYSIDSVFVHYEQNGNHLGTGEVVMKKKDAQRVLIDLKGISIDGSLLKLTIVDGGDGTSIFNRVQMVKKVEKGGIQKKRSVASGSMKRRSMKKLIGGKRHPLDRSDKTASNKTIRGKGGRRVNKPKTEEELDAELESYMKKPSMEQ